MTPMASMASLGLSWALCLSWPLLAMPLAALAQPAALAPPAEAPAAAPAAPAAATAAPAAATAGPDRATALTARVTLKVVHPDDVRRRLVEAADPIGGFPVLVEPHRLTLKVPPAQLAPMLDRITAAGLVLEKTLERADLTGEIAQLEALLRSKREIFDRLRRLVDGADTTATLRIEQSMSAIVAEMEAIAGRLRVERARAQHAVIDVSFEFRERERIVYVRSPFDWLNSVDLGQFDARF